MSSVLTLPLLVRKPADSILRIALALHKDLTIENMRLELLSQYHIVLWCPPIGNVQPCILGIYQPFNMASILATKALGHVTDFDNSFVFSSETNNATSPPKLAYKTENLAGFPDHLDSQLCWTPATIQQLGTQAIVTELSSSDILAIEYALAHFRSMYCDYVVTI